MPDDDPRLFLYRDCIFSCVPQDGPGGMFIVQVGYLSGPYGEPKDLPEDAKSYSSEAEARRQGERRAMLWVHDKTDEKRGQ